MKRLLPKNINKAGRALRLLIGIALVTLGVWKLNWIYILFGLFCFFEALMSWCVVYHLLGINECKCKKK